MYQTINQSQFIDAFKQWDTYKNNFSYNGLIALYEYLENLEDETGENLKLDVVAICCDYSEYKDIDEIKENYTNIEDIEDLKNNTKVIEFEGGIIIQDY